MHKEYNGGLMNKYEVAVVIASLVASIILFLCNAPETFFSTFQIMGIGAAAWLVTFFLVLVEVDHG